MKTSRSSSAPFELAPLPWKDDALAPLVSADTIRFHYGKHHRGYVDTLKIAEDFGSYGAFKAQFAIAVSGDRVV